ncbi:MAG: hypothetical protein AB7U78_25795 [Hyphomicrobiaceae bacterium]
MLNTSKIAAVAVVSGILTGPAYASTVWHFPYKATPFAMSHESEKSTAINPNVRGTKHRDLAALAGVGMTLAHHKPPYHGGVPRSPRAHQGARDTA